MKKKDNMNQQQDDQKVKIILRIRPLLANEDPQQFITVSNHNTIEMNKPGYVTCMKFAKVHQESGYDKENQQFQLFQDLKEAVSGLFQGINSTIFAYGQTGAGKTYTIMGDCPQKDSPLQEYYKALTENSCGVISRSLRMIFEYRRRKKNIRLRKIYDLSQKNPKELKIRQTKRGQTIIQGLQQTQVVNQRQSYLILSAGIKNRSTNSTASNVQSSRSHSIFTILYDQLIENMNQTTVISSKLSIIDLAGSQKFNISNHLSITEKCNKINQLKAINGSLSKLGHCISALAQTHKTHVPFRDSKLTRILKDSFLSTAKIRLIVCVSPSISSMSETTSTLQFADLSKKVTLLRPFEDRRKTDHDQHSQLMQQLQYQRNRRMQLQAMINECSLKKSIELLNENAYLKQQLAATQQHLSLLLNREPQIYDKLSNNSIFARNTYTEADTHIRDRISQNKTECKAQVACKNKKKRAQAYNLSPGVAGNYCKAPQKTPTNKVFSRISVKNVSTGQNIVHSKSINNAITSKTVYTPPKTAAERSISQIDCKSDLPSKKSDLSAKIKLDQKSSQPKTCNFQSKIRKFMLKNHQDKLLEQRVKERLLQISKNLHNQNTLLQEQEANSKRKM